MVINTRNSYVFKGHKALLGGKFVTYGELEFRPKYDLFDKSEFFDWGNMSPSSEQLAFSILCQIANEEFAREYYHKFTQEIVRELNSRDWVLPGSEVISWIKQNTDVVEEEPQTLQNQKVPKKKKINVVKQVCNELNITQKTLAAILEVPEGTVSSWAVKNEIPRLGKKAIEFYIEKQKNQQIVDSYKSFVNLLNAS
jgi:DNA-binding transcriptional regulator YiaG